MIAAKKLLMAGGAAKPGQAAFTTPGTFNWTVPKGVKSVCAVAVGSGQSGGPSGPGSFSGSGGDLRYVNDFTVTPGQVIQIIVGANGGESRFGPMIAFGASKGQNTSPGVGFVGGRGFTSGGESGGGGAAGYAGDGGGGLSGAGGGATSGSGGGGGGGAQRGRGGGVGIMGQGPSGAGATSFGASGQPGSGGSGAQYGGGGASTGPTDGGSGAVRIIWGRNRAFPSLNTGDV